MTLTEKSLKKLGESLRIHYSKEQERFILDRFGTEPSNGREWTEQDIAEQIRKICGSH